MGRKSFGWMEAEKMMRNEVDKIRATKRAQIVESVEKNWPIEIWTYPTGQKTEELANAIRHAEKNRTIIILDEPAELYGMQRVSSEQALELIDFHFDRLMELC